MTKLPFLRLPLIVLAALAIPGLALAQGGIPSGKYECWYFSRPLPGLNFTIQGGGRYTDIEGKQGTYTFQGGDIAFHGGAFDGQHARFRPGPPPTIAIMGTGGRETETCQPPH